MSVGWTQDEVIVVVGFLMQRQERQVSTLQIEPLSDFLRGLPIHPKKKHDPSFRSASGLLGQIRYLYKSLSGEKRNSHMQEQFVTLYREAQKDKKHMVQIAEAIKRCMPVYSEIPFGAQEEQGDFPEGALLGHLHRYYEARDGRIAPAVQRCQVCGVSQQKTCRAGVRLLQAYLLVPPEDLAPDADYKKAPFIYVCPNCHHALHQLRPWRKTLQTCRDILDE